MLSRKGAGPIGRNVPLTVLTERERGMENANEGKLLVFMDFRFGYKMICMLGFSIFAGCLKTFEAVLWQYHLQKYWSILEQK